MVVKLIELGPFGCRIDLGTADSLQDIPEGYEIKGVTVDPELVTAFVEPVTLKATIRSSE